MPKCMRQVLPFLLTLGIVLMSPAHAAQNTTGSAEARQSTEDTSPQAQYKRAQREANAAYRQALTDCRKMNKSERSACEKEAKANLQSDLAEAKKMRSDGK